MRHQPQGGMAGVGRSHAPWRRLVSGRRHGWRLGPHDPFLGPSAVALAAAVMLALLVLGVADARFESAFGLSGIVPIAIAALVFGARGGLLAAGAVIAAQLGLLAAHDEALLTFTHGARAVAGLVVGGLVGTQASARRAALESLARRNELSLDLAAVVSADGRLIDLNPEWTRLLGYSLDEMCGRSMFDFIHPDDHAPSRRGQHQTAAGGRLRGFQNRYRHRDGSYRWLEWNVQVDPKTGEKIGVARDISDRKRVEEIEGRQKLVLEGLVAERTAELEHRTQELHESRRENLRRLAIAAEYRDFQSEEHMARVGRLAAALARALGASEAFAELIQEAAPLHDIGKLGVPDTILLKPTSLSTVERRRMNQHTLIGAHILGGSDAPDIQLAEEIARTHHEWWNGTGYPNRLGGQQIPLSGRIVAVADVFDALTHDRPYKDAWPSEQALAEIEALSGRQFDPEVVDALIGLQARPAASGPETVKDAALPRAAGELPVRRAATSS